jgi:archaemetzincin
LGDIPPSYVSYVYDHIRAIISTIAIKNTAPLPHSAYVKSRNRYRADSIIIQLSRTTPAGSVTIALTSVDISCTNDDIPDWGVFGLSYCPGKACVASCYRTKVNKASGLFFTAIHELGHTQGLDHCNAPSCLMNDANGHTIDAETFCPKCKAFLKAKGWQL